MSDAARLTPATPEDLAFALRYSERKRTHDAGEIMATIVAKRLVERLERSGFVVMKTGDDAGMVPPSPPARSKSDSTLNVYNVRWTERLRRRGVARHAAVS